MEKSTSVEAQISSFPAVYGTGRFIIMLHVRPSLDPVSSQTNPVLDAHTTYLLRNVLNIVLLSKPRCIYHPHAVFISAFLM